MTDPPPKQTYRIEDLAHHTNTTVRTIRAYQDRGLLPRPERQGRANLYSTAHITRLHQIADLLDRGYTLASIKELLDAWDTGRGLGGVLGLVTEVEGPWTDEEPIRITRAELLAHFAGTPADGPATQATAGTTADADAGTTAEAVADAVADAIDLGVLEPLEDTPDAFLVPSPQELAVAAELHASGVPLSAISGHLRELRVQVEHMAARFLEFTTEYVFARYLDDPGHRTDAHAAEAATLIRRLRPLAQQTVDAELARAMRHMATRHLRTHLGAEAPAAPSTDTRLVTLPGETVRAVENLVGKDHAPTFIALAAERETRARALDDLTASAAASRENDLREPPAAAKLGE
ncbi:MerR family transcriptional regulator [Streptomyces sp. L2]|uniref:MerR family transcriptional regulator n=1 Tax=Streptomyces sp. L2 TaxID=2162665 RepID=UPI0010104C7A|nr:MerR family transcriptional regulator [Streptomyces sp. L2]